MSRNEPRRGGSCASARRTLSGKNDDAAVNAASRAAVPKSRLRVNFFVREFEISEVILFINKKPTRVLPASAEENQTRGLRINSIATEKLSI